MLFSLAIQGMLRPIALALLLLATPFAVNYARAQENIDLDDCPCRKMQQATGPLFDLTFLVSGFVTDKGELTRDSRANDFKEHLNVHTGDYNVLLIPNVALGYSFKHFDILARLGAVSHWMRLNLPYGQSAEGWNESLEFGPEMYFRVYDKLPTTVEVGGGAALRGSLPTDLRFQPADGGPSSVASFDKGVGFSLSAGVGGDFAMAGALRFGWLTRLLWTRGELESKEEMTMNCHGAPCTTDNQRISMDIYSALLGLRIRWLPFAAK